jgi:hypothetical protein
MSFVKRGLSLFRVPESERAHARERERGRERETKNENESTETVLKRSTMESVKRGEKKGALEVQTVCAHYVSEKERERERKRLSVVFLRLPFLY